MTADEVVEDVMNQYSEWFEMMEPPDAMNFLIDQLARRVVEAREEATQYKMTLKRRDLMETR